jgi:transposase InsO family protein
MMPLQGSSIEHLCQLAEVSRSGLYRRIKEKEPRAEEMEVRAAIQQICLSHRQYGYRRVAAELKRQGMSVNHKRVARLMRTDNLLGLQKPTFVVTTDSRHDLEIFHNLARQMKPQSVDQLWVADITYIRLQHEFVYLAVVLDAFSRRVIGWNLERQCQSRLAIAALQRAIALRQPQPGLVHHSDRGIQYACPAYRLVLQKYQMVPSMSRAGCPYDNAACESFMSTLKREEIHAHRYRNLEDLRGHVSKFIEEYYNSRRLHSALGYQPPEEFERRRQLADRLRA